MTTVVVRTPNSLLINGTYAGTGRFAEWAAEKSKSGDRMSLWLVVNSCISPSVREEPSNFYTEINDSVVHK
jgi:hypothetical protein